MNRLLLFTVVVGTVVAVSVLPGSDVNHVQYLRNFGYISKDSSLVQSDTDMRKAISEFQSMAGIKQTGSGEVKVTPIQTTNTYDITTTVIPKEDNICLYPSFDAIIKIQYQIYAFKGSYYYKLRSRNPHKRYPIGSKFIGIPNDINAILAILDTIYFFKGNQVYKYHGGRVQSGFPRDTNTVFTGLPSRIDAAFSIGRDAYFIAGNTYYRSTIDKGGVASRAVSVAAFSNGPKKIDAMFHWEGKGVMLFSGDKYATWNLETKSFGRISNILSFMRCYMIHNNASGLNMS